MAELQHQDVVKSSNQDMAVDKEYEILTNKPVANSDDVKKQCAEAKTKESLNGCHEDKLSTDGISPENKSFSCSEKSLSTEEDDKSNSEGNSSVNESHGDGKLESQKTIEPATTPEDNSDAGSSVAIKTGEDHTGNEKVPATEAGTQEECIGIKKPQEKTAQKDDTKNEKSEETMPQEDKKLLEATTPQEDTREKKLLEAPKQSTDQEVDELTAIDETDVEDGGGKYLFWILVFGGVLLGMFVQKLIFQTPPQKSEMQKIDIFLQNMENVKNQFPNQRPELWDRSKIHLKRHLLTAKPTEPVSLILTSGLGAERTLHCLAQSVASAFSAALNASYLYIDGASKAGLDSDQVKLDIDTKLQGAFDGDKPVAIIHRFEELPPGSTLIFYRYCDHENAAYKKTFLIFTVLLDEKEEIPAKTLLSVVEEMVDDHLQKKFLSDDRPVSFDSMDIDKYSGLWSRISHLILPVAAEKIIEQKGC